MRSQLLRGTVIALALSVGCSYSDPGVTASVKTRLAADDTAKALKIDVDTKDRVVTLTGEVRSPQEATKAVEIARATKGVASVVDHISVVPDAGPAASPTTGRLPAEPGRDALLSDSAMTAAIKTKLLADPFVGGLKIDVDTTDGVVTLKGDVKTQAEKDRALAITREMAQVRRVEDRLTLKPGR